MPSDRSDRDSARIIQVAGMLYLATHAFGQAVGMDRIDPKKLGRVLDALDTLSEAIQQSLKEEEPDESPIH